MFLNPIILRVVLLYAEIRGSDNLEAINIPSSNKGSRRINECTDCVFRKLFIIIVNHSGERGVVTQKLKTLISYVSVERSVRMLDDGVARTSASSHHDDGLSAPAKSTRNKNMKSYLKLHVASRTSIVPGFAAR